MGTLNNYITFGGIKTSDYGVYISGEGTYNAPARRGEFIEIPGRNGALFIDAGGFENITVEYPASIYSTEDGVFKSRLQDLRMMYKSKYTYTRLTDTYHPDEFRLGLYREGLEVDPSLINRAGHFVLAFDCKPQRFLVSGETPVAFTRAGTITNPTEFAALPLLKVSGYGTITIGDYQIYVAENDEPFFYIDSELMEAYIPAAAEYVFTDEQGHIMTDEHLFEITFVNGPVVPKSMLEYVTFKNHIFPKIEPGVQPVEITSTITRLEITPRWWRV